MPAVLIQAIFTQVLLPELARWLASRGKDQPFPAEAELLAQLSKNADAIIAAGNAFLQSKNAL